MTTATPNGSPAPVPTGKAERRRRRNPTTRLFEVVFRATGRTMQALVELERVTLERLEVLEAAREELEGQVAQLRRDVHAARALYYDTHDSITGEHLSDWWHRPPRGDGDRVT